MTVGEQNPRFQIFLGTDPATEKTYFEQNRVIILVSAAAAFALLAHVSPIFLWGAPWALVAWCVWAMVEYVVKDSDCTFYQNAQTRCTYKLSKIDESWTYIFDVAAAASATSPEDWSAKIYLLGLETRCHNERVHFNLQMFYKQALIFTSKVLFSRRFDPFMMPKDLRGIVINSVENNLKLVLRARSKNEEKKEVPTKGISESD